MTLEELIRDRATKGELVHLSLVCSVIDGKWHGVYAYAHAFGVHSATGDDPIAVLTEALTGAKTSRKRVTAAVTEEAPRIDKHRGTKYPAAELREKTGKLADWMKL